MKSRTFSQDLGVGAAEERAVVGEGVDEIEDVTGVLQARLVDADLRRGGRERFVGAEVESDEVARQVLFLWPPRETRYEMRVARCGCMAAAEGFAQTRWVAVPPGTSWQSSVERRVMKVEEVFAELWGEGEAAEVFEGECTLEFEIFVETEADGVAPTISWALRKGTPLLER